MGSYDRKTTVSAYKAFSTGWVQAIADSLVMKDRASRRRIDTLDKVSQGFMLVRAQVLNELVTPPVLEWVRPEFIIDKNGYVTNILIPPDGARLNLQMIIEAGLVINNPKNAVWTDWVSPAPAVASFCMIPGFNGTVRTGTLWLTPKAAFGDKIIADTSIVLVREEGRTDIEADYAEESYDVLPDGPDGTVWYHQWFIRLPETDDITPKTIMEKLTASGTSISSFFDIYSAMDPAADCFVPDDAELTYGFVYHPLTLELAEASVTELISKLTYVFDDTFIPSNGQTRSVVIQLPEAEEEDGKGISDKSRYLTPDGHIAIASSNIKWDYEIDNEISSGHNIIVFATRVDADTVVFCDNTRMYRSDFSNGTFKPSAGSRRLIMTGCGISATDLDILSYTNETRDTGSIAPWTEGSTGYYNAPSLLWSTDEKLNRNVWQNNTRRMMFYKHADVSTGVTPILRGLLTLDRNRGYSSFGGGIDETNKDLPSRNLRGLVVSIGVSDIPWEDTLINIVASTDTRSNAGFVFSRQDTSVTDGSLSSFLFQGYTMPVGSSGPWSTSPGSYTGLYMLTRARKLMLGAGPESYKTLAPSDYLADGSNWRTVFNMIGGVDPSTDAAILSTSCRGGATYAAGALLPGINDYKSTYVADGLAEACSVSRITNAKGVYSSSIPSNLLDYEYDNLNITMWSQQNHPEDSFIKLMRKVGDIAGTGTDPWRDLPGEVGLRVGKRAYSSGLIGPCAELSAFSSIGTGDIYGRTKYIPKVMTAVYDVLPSGANNSSIAFCGLTSGTSIEECDQVGEGLSVKASASGGHFTLLRSKDLTIVYSGAAALFSSIALTPGQVSLGTNAGVTAHLNTSEFKAYTSAGSLSINSSGRTTIKCGQANEGLLIGGISVAAASISLFQNTLSTKLIGANITESGLHLYAAYQNASYADTRIKATIVEEPFIGGSTVVMTGTLKRRRITSAEGTEDLLVFVVS